MYGEYMHRMWTRSTKEDFWQKELEQIGQQEIRKWEVYGVDTEAAPQNEIFGWQDRYAEYKHIQSSVHGDFRDTLNYWHLARQFASAPELNNDFVTCDPSKRVFAEQTANSLWLMVNHSIQARRLVRRGSGSRIL